MKNSSLSFLKNHLKRLAANIFLASHANLTNLC